MNASRHLLCVAAAALGQSCVFHPINGTLALSQAEANLALAHHELVGQRIALYGTVVAVDVWRETTVKKKRKAMVAAAIAVAAQNYAAAIGGHQQPLTVIAAPETIVGEELIPVAILIPRTSSDSAARGFVVCRFEAGAMQAAGAVTAGHTAALGGEVTDVVRLSDGTPAIVLEGCRKDPKIR